MIAAKSRALVLFLNITAQQQRAVGGYPDFWRGRSLVLRPPLEVWDTVRTAIEAARAQALREALA